jgi:hypothetical protein
MASESSSAFRYRAAQPGAAVARPPGLTRRLEWTLTADGADERGCEPPGKASEGAEGHPAGETAVVVTTVQRSPDQQRQQQAEDASRDHETAIAHRCAVLRPILPITDSSISDELTFG